MANNNQIQPYILNQKPNKMSQKQNSKPNRLFHFNAFAKSAFTFLLQHVRVFFSILDLTQEGTFKADVISLSTPNNVNNTIHYLIAFIILLLNMLDSGLIFAQAGFHYNVTRLDRLLTHKIYPRQFWYTGTVMVHAAMLMSIVVYGLLTFKPMLNEQFIIYIYRSKVDGSLVKVMQNGRVWQPKDANRFIKFRKIGQKILLYIQISVYCSAIPIWSFSIVLNSRGTFRDYLFLAYTPLFGLYACFGVVYISFCFMLSANYIRLQQQFLIEKLNTLRVQIGSKTRRRISSSNIWRRFTSHNDEILQFFKQLGAISRFWSPHLSIYFLVHISIEVFLIYGLVFASQNLDWIMRYYFAFFAFEFMALILAITAACSAVIRYNVLIYKTNVAFCFGYTERVKDVPLMVQFKMNQMIANYKGTRNGFRLVTNYTVDSTMFEAIFAYISTMFFKVFTD